MSLSPKEEAVLKLIEEDIAYESYFFKKVSDKKWFYHLKERNYFSPEKNKSPEEAEEKGFFRIPEWNVLQYLEKISEQIKENPVKNNEYITVLLQIIADVTNYKNDNGKHIDNYRTWWYFVKILCNLPKESINNEILELISIWQDSKFDTTLQGSEIVNKLLPKFIDSTDPEDWVKAQKIVEKSLTLKEIQVSETTKKYKTAIEPFWIEQSFLTKNNAYKLGETCGIDLIHKVSANLKKLLIGDIGGIYLEIEANTYRLQLIPNTTCFKVCISIAEDKKRDDTVFLPEENWKLINTIDVPENIEDIDINRFYELMIQQITRINLYDVFSSNIGEKVLKSELIDLYIQIFHKETYSSFYSKKQHYEHNIIDLLTEILKNIVISKSKKNIPDTKEIIQLFFKDNYLYFSKMALYIIGFDEENVNNYRDILFEYYIADEFNILMDGIFYGDEIKHLLSNLKNISADEKKIIVQKIEQGPRLIQFKDAERINIWKLERYNALNHDDYFKEKHEQLKQEAAIGWEPQLSPAIGEVQTGFVEYVPPKDAEQIFSQSSVVDIVDYIMKYNPPESTDFFRPEGVSGLVGELGKAIQKEPLKFIDGLSLFSDTGYYYINSLIRNIITLWKNKSSILTSNVGKILVFIKDYINKPGFWDGKLLTLYDDEWKADHRWVIGTIGEFIQEGTKDDSWAFDEKYLLQIKDILFFILSKIVADAASENNDPVTDALNTHQGKIIEAFIDYSLRVARINQKKNGKKEINWLDDAQAKYDELLAKNILEAYTLLGRYLPQFNYLNKQWVAKKIKEFEYIEKEELWEVFMTGYLYCSQVFKTIYNLMGNHYQKALGYNFKNKNANEASVHHAAYGYLRNHEVGNLIYKQLIDKWDYEQIKELVSFFWTQRDDKEKQEIAERIIGFWEWVYENKYRDKSEDTLTKEDKNILSELCNLTIFLSEINSKNYEWLKTTAPFVDAGFHSSFFIEYLDRLKDKGKSIDYVGKIYLEMLKKTTPEFQRDNIISIVEYLYQNEKADEANDICDVYGRRGSDILTAIHEKHNK